MLRVLHDDKVKRCSQCGRHKELAEFNRNKYAIDGLRCYCRSCQASLKRAYLEKKDKEMNLAKYQAKQQGLNSQLRKVLDATPCVESWMAPAISAEMRRLGTGGADSRTTLGCLNSLLEMGLVEEVSKGHFRRVQVKERQPIPEPRLVAVKNTTQEPEVIQVKPAMPAVSSATVTPIEKLSKLASRLRDLANDMESAALELAEQAEKNEAETVKMRQLQALLKSLG